jgi:hypothetical protein
MNKNQDPPPLPTKQVDQFKARVFVNGKHLKPSLMFVAKPGACTIKLFYSRNLQIFVIS